MKIYTLKWSIRFNGIQFNNEVKGDATSIWTVISCFDRGRPKCLDYKVFEDEKEVDMKEFLAEDKRIYEEKKQKSA